MLRTFKKSIVYFLLIGSCNAVFAQHKIELSGQFIPRLEQRHGYRTLAPKDSKSSVFISERIRLNFDYQNKYVRVFTSIQDVRVWGNEPQAQNYGSFGLHEGWAEIFIKDKASVKLGRQELVYDDHRLLGNLDWVQAARSHDAILIKVKHKNAQLHMGGGFNQSSENLLGTVYKVKNYKALAFAWYNQKFDSSRSALSVYAIADGMQINDSVPTTKFRFTIGPRAEFKYKHVNANIGAYVQTGKTISDKTILAFMANVYAEYTHPKFNIGAGYDYISGQNASKTTNTKYNSFNTLYPTNHKFYGHMDYFLDLPSDTKLGGLQDVYLRLNYRPKPKGMLGLDAHYFLSGNKVANPTSAGSYLKLPLGSELDAYGTYKPYDFLEVRAGYSIMAATSSMEVIKPTGSRKAYQGWSFVMISLKPSFFKWEKEAKAE
ncbi:MAG TPA: alginate export family protein [Chitinophagales bacterium]|nr:alginate export family protein [Chitinophagales bacterium]